MRIGSDPTQGGAYSSYHWNILLDIDDDGYKEYWIDLEGSYESGGTKADRVQILYNNDNTQQVSDPDAARVEQFEARYNDDLATYPNNHTRLLAVGDGSGDYWIEPGESLVFGVNADTDTNGGVDVDVVYDFSSFVMANGAVLKSRSLILSNS